MLRDKLNQLTVFKRGGTREVDALRLALSICSQKALSDEHLLLGVHLTLPEGDFL